MMSFLEKQIFEIKNNEQFAKVALEIFSFQSRENMVYSNYLDYLKVKASEVKNIIDIPFLPIEFFKSHKVVCNNKRSPDLVFESSGTGGQNKSRHYIESESMYKTSFRMTFKQFFGNPEQQCILALLPSYLERENSSLVFMMKDLIGISKHPDSGFYLNDLAGLSNVINARNKDRTRTILLGVSFALLDLANKYPQALGENIRVIETGGMKGRKKEMIRQELHQKLKNAFNLKAVHSEYGMTELLSQAYLQENGRFRTPPWMKVLIRDVYDPLSLLQSNQSGAINIIDLANLHSCSFIATGDIGKVFQDGSFEVSGRMDHAEIRGCNLMVI